MFGRQEDGRTRCKDGAGNRRKDGMVRQERAQRGGEGDKRGQKREREEAAFLTVPSPAVCGRRREPFTE